MIRYPQPPKPSPDDAEEPSDEEKRLWMWRYQIARDEAGLADPDACLAADQGIDTHALTDLTRAGCEPSTALRILLQ